MQAAQSRNDLSEKIVLTSFTKGGAQENGKQAGPEERKFGREMDINNNEAGKAGSFL